MREKYSAQLMEIIQQRGLLYPLDVALVGATGVGKSSTINALFKQDVAKVGKGSTPETMEISHYMVSNVLRLHDTAGFGDGINADVMHSKKLTKLLLSKCTEKGTYISYGLIDLVFVILDGSHRDMGTTYKLLESVVLKNVPPDRIIVGINQCDVAMKGRNWDSLKNAPNPILHDFLEQQASSVQSRLREATGITISKPIYYSAEYKFNIHKLMEHIIKHMPYQRRIIY